MDTLQNGGDTLETKDPAYLRLQSLLTDFIENSDLEDSKRKQLQNIVSLYISYYETLSTKMLSKERIAQRFIRKTSEAKTKSSLKKEFEKERELLIGKLNEAGALIEKYSSKAKKAKEKAKQKQGILKQFIEDKDSEIVEQKERIIHLEALNDEYLIQYQGVSELSDNLQEQLAASEEKLEKLLRDNNNVEAIVKETNDNNAVLIKQLLKENTENHEALLQQHLEESNREKKLLKKELEVSSIERGNLEQEIKSLKRELSNQYINAVNSAAERQNKNNRDQEHQHAVADKDKTSNSSRFPKKAKKVDAFRSASDISTVSKKVKTLESSLGTVDHVHETLPNQASKYPTRTKRTRRSSSIRRVYETSSIVVATRIRPMNDEEKKKILSRKEEISQSAVVTTNNGRTLNLDVDCDDNEAHSNREIRSFDFDATFGSDVGQDIVYLLTGKHVLDRFLAGFNGTIFAYGQTGSGKTYTMMGDPNNYNVGNGAETDGITPRLVRGIFDHLKNLEENSSDVQWALSVTYIEIYMESIRDLLSRNTRGNASSSSNYRVNKKQNNLVDIRIRKDGSTSLKGAKEINAQSFEQLMKCINEGTRRRSTERTNANATSSRSHSVVTLKLTLIEGSESESTVDVKSNSRGNITSASSSTVVSKLHIVDLAGSENADATEGVSQQRRQEGLHINKSLLALHRVIRTLTKEKEGAVGKGVFVPYRASKLTRLLKDSLGGNCFTLMICNLSPSPLCFAETKRSIQFAQSVKNVKNKAVKNVDPKTSRIKQLEAENKKLKQLVLEYKKLMMETIVLEDDDDEEEDEDGYKRDNDSLRSESTADSTF